jgi:hypothetical protein
VRVDYKLSIKNKMLTTQHDTSSDIGNKPMSN